MESYLPLKVQTGDSEFFLYYRQHCNDPETADPERSLFVCRLDRKIKTKQVTELFQVCGKIDSVQTGKFEKSKEAQSAAPGLFVYFAVVTFKKRGSLKNALRPEWLQRKLDASRMEAQPEDSLLQEHIEKMEEGGFQMVMPKSTSHLEKGDLFEAAVSMKDVEMHNQKKMKKRDIYLKDFYNFQLRQDEDAPNPLKKQKTG